MKIINGIGVVFALGLVLQLYFGVKNGYSLQNGIGSTLWIASIVGLGALLAANVYELVNSSGASLVTTGNKMRNAFFGAFAGVGILLSVQSILLLNDSDTIFIPHWFLDLAWIFLGLGAFAWIMLAGLYGITTGITRFHVWLTGNYKWLIFAGILLLLVGLATFFISDEFSFFTKDESLFKFKKEQRAKETPDGKSRAGRPDRGCRHDHQKE